MSILRYVMLLCGLMLAATLTICAQNANSALSGVVRDQHGDVIAGAQVKVLNTGTAQTRDAMTGTDGAFTVPVLPAGDYSVTLLRDGFAPLEITDIVLGVGEERAFRVELKVGTVREQVTVEAGALRGLSKDTPESPALVTNVERKFIEKLPLNGRTLQPLITTAAGVVALPVINGAPGRFSVNGQRDNANYFMVDGVSANVGAGLVLAPGQESGGTLPALTISGGTQSLVSVDEVEAVQIQTSGYAARYGRQPGAQIEFISRSGSNLFNGSLSGSWRPAQLSANDWFANRYTPRTGHPVSPEPLRAHQFSGALGGPLVANKLFFFAAYRRHQSACAAIATPGVGL